MLRRVYWSEALLIVFGWRPIAKSFGLKHQVAFSQMLESEEI